MILRFLFYVFLFYLAYRLIFDFIIPVVRTTRQVKRGFREMQERMNQHAEQYQGQNSNQKSTAGIKDEKQQESGDYIEFEEVK